MNTRISRLLYWIAGSAIIGGFLFSLISYLKVCSEACGKAHDYTLCGFSFECYGLIFFPVIGLLHFACWSNTISRFMAALLISAAFGAEIDFLLVQKYEIKSFCPICLTIAAFITTILITYIISYLLELKEFILKDQRREIMKSIRKGLSAITFVFLGFLFAFVGIVKETPLEAAESSIKDNLVLGNLKSPATVYFFSDWQCPACRTVEPALEKMASKVMEKAKFIFVDTVVHKETLNFIPYNLSFLVHNKSKYLELRKILTEISKTNTTPTESQIKKAVQPIGVKYEPLNYADVSGANAYFDELVKQFNIEFTPTMVIVAKPGAEPKKLQGSEITESNVMKAINQK